MTLLAALLWATSFSVIKVGLRFIEPYSFLFLRFLIATALLAAVVLFSGKGGVLARYLANRYSFFLGLALAASFGLQFRAQTEIPASTAAIIINSSTLLVAPLSALILHERIGPRKVSALILGLVGVYLITARSAGEAGGTLLGNVLISGSAVSTALYIVLTKRAVSRKMMDEVPLLTAVFAWSLPLYLAAAAPSLASAIRAGGQAWLTTVYLAVFCSALAFLLWVKAIRRIGALTSAIVLLSELVFGVLIAHVFLAETLPLPTVAGCALIGLGIVIVGLRE
jgi:drug/metabolite transporter (DMT)-like permease